MRNYYRTLDAERETPSSELVPLLEDLSQTEPEITDKATPVLLNHEWREQYNQIHLQYEAISLAYQYFADDITDTNNWDRRLVEFLPE